MTWVPMARISGNVSRMLVLCVYAFVSRIPHCEAAELKPEYEVKAAFLLNFTKFIAWPPGAFENAASPLNICILGDDPFGGTLDDLVRGESVDGRTVAVQRIRRAPSPKSCQ